MDWTRTKKSFYRRREEEPDASTQTSSKLAKNINDNNFYGIGSFLRNISGIDLALEENKL